MSGNQHRSPWTPEVIEKVSRLWREGLTSSEIVDRMGSMFTREALNSKARTMRDLFPAKMDTGKNRKIELDLGPIAEMWNAGKSSTVIGAHFGVKPSWVRSMAQQNRPLFSAKTSGYQKRVPKRKPQDNPVEVQRMPLPTAGTWAAIELDQYELSRLPGLTMAENEGCKYPLTDTGPHLFCSAPKMELKPYCAYHAVKCAGPGTMSERRAHKA